VKPDLSASLVFSVSVLAWSIAYLLIVYHGFTERTYGMPMPALAANLSWEFIWAFVWKPFSDIGHILTIPWLGVDLVIAAQCLMYGGNDATEPFLRKYYRWLFAAAVAIAFPVIYMCFKEFNDWYAEFTAAGDSLLISVLFIGLLIRRRGPRGQSMYIAVSKWLGTFLAWIATSLTVNTTPARLWPSSPWAFISDTVRHTAYPLTPLINFLYAVTFVADLLYIVMLRSSLRESGIPIWRRI
jgi:hypothetical protein